MTPSTRSRRLTVLIASLAGTAAVLASGAQPATGAAAKPAPTKATISWTPPNIKVKVTSPKASCKAPRRAFILYTTGGEPNGAAHGVTASNGVFTFTDAGTPSDDGNLIAYVARKRGCRPGQSSQLPVEGVPVRAAQRARTFAKVTYDETAITVKVTSPKPACAKGRRVAIFAYQAGEPYAESLIGTTDNQGVFTYSIAARAGFGVAPTYKLTAFVKRNPTCAVGQANTIAISPS